MPNPFNDFNRDIRFHVSSNNGEIALSATLKDVFHDILLTVNTEPVNLTITAASLKFFKQPADNCAQIEKAVQRLVGISIGKGISKKLLEIFGGSQGCGNIRTLLTGLLPLALNARAAMGYDDLEEMLDNIKSQLTGSCIGYPATKNE